VFTIFESVVRRYILKGTIHEVLMQTTPYLFNVSQSAKKEFENNISWVRIIFMVQF